MIEPIINAPSVHQIKRMVPGGLKQYFHREFGGPNSEQGIQELVHAVIVISILYSVIIVHFVTIKRQCRISY